MQAVDILSRFVHIGTVIVLVGGSFFMRFVLMPAAERLSDSEHAALRERVMDCWRKIVHAGIALILISGVYNLIRTLKSYDVDAIYHSLFGIKFLLALAVFFLASAMVGRSSALEAIRQNRKKWLGIAILFAAIIVAISAYLKVKPKTLKSDVPAVQTTMQSVTAGIRE